MQMAKRPVSARQDWQRLRRHVKLNKHFYLKFHSLPEGGAATARAGSALK
jgi:hypothetical protein